MRENLALAVFTILFLGILLGFVSYTHPSEPPPPEVTARILDADPEFFAGKIVRVKTDGMESGDGELYFRKQTDKPAVVRCRFKDKLPDKIPATITGLCIGRQGDAVVVMDCR